MPKNNWGQQVYLFIRGQLNASGIDPRANNTVYLLKLIKIKNDNKQNIPANNSAIFIET